MFIENPRVIYGPCKDPVSFDITSNMCFLLHMSYFQSSVFLILKCIIFHDTSFNLSSICLCDIYIYDVHVLYVYTFIWKSSKTYL